ENYIDEKAFTDRFVQQSLDELKYHYPSNINATIEFEPILPQWLLSLLPFQCGNPPVFSAHINQS
ncbi:hypothetical protein KTN00_16300, partial [Acinetobacter soli]|uniref:hypothetical protein n=1 Tax=Acinetobacter soli TaxID=487316 RepID=UPI001C44DC00